MSAFSDDEDERQDEDSLVAFSSVRETTTQATTLPGVALAVWRVERRQEADQRQVQKQLLRLERRLQDATQVSPHNRGHWAELQGYVDGLSETVQGLVRKADVPVASGGGNDGVGVRVLSARVDAFVEDMAGLKARMLEMDEAVIRVAELGAQILEVEQNLEGLTIEGHNVAEEAQRQEWQVEELSMRMQGIERGHKRLVAMAANTRDIRVKLGHVCNKVADLMTDTCGDAEAHFGDQFRAEITMGDAAQFVDDTAQEMELHEGLEEQIEHLHASVTEINDRAPNVEHNHQGPAQSLNMQPRTGQSGEQVLQVGTGATFSTIHDSVTMAKQVQELKERLDMFISNNNDPMQAQPSEELFHQMQHPHQSNGKNNLNSQLVKQRSEDAASSSCTTATTLHNEIDRVECTFKSLKDMHEHINSMLEQHNNIVMRLSTLERNLQIITEIPGLKDQIEQINERNAQIINNFGGFVGLNDLREQFNTECIRTMKLESHVEDLNSGIGSLHKQVVDLEVGCQQLKDNLSVMVENHQSTECLQKIKGEHTKFCARLEAAEQSLEVVTGTIDRVHKLHLEMDSKMLKTEHDLKTVALLDDFKDQEKIMLSQFNALKTRIDLVAASLTDIPNVHDIEQHMDHMLQSKFESCANKWETAIGIPVFKEQVDLMHKWHEEIDSRLTKAEQHLDENKSLNELKEQIDALSGELRNVKFRMEEFASNSEDKTTVQKLTECMDHMESNFEGIVEIRALTEKIRNLHSRELLEQVCKPQELHAEIYPNFAAHQPSPSVIADIQELRDRLHQTEIGLESNVGMVAMTEKHVVELRRLGEQVAVLNTQVVKLQSRVDQFGCDHERVPLQEVDQEYTYNGRNLAEVKGSYEQGDRANIGCSNKEFQRKPFVTARHTNMKPFRTEPLAVVESRVSTVMERLEDLCARLLELESSVEAAGVTAVRVQVEQLRSVVDARIDTLVSDVADVAARQLATQCCLADVASENMRGRLERQCIQPSLAPKLLHDLSVAACQQHEHEIPRNIREEFKGNLAAGNVNAVTQKAMDGTLGSRSSTNYARVASKTNASMSPCSTASCGSAPIKALAAIAAPTDQFRQPKVTEVEEPCVKPPITQEGAPPG